MKAIDTPPIDLDEARLLLLAAVSVARHGEPDNYIVARLAQLGYDRARVERAARRLVNEAQCDGSRQENEQ